MSDETFALITFLLVIVITNYSVKKVVPLVEGSIGFRWSRVAIGISLMALSLILMFIGLILASDVKSRMVIFWCGGVVFTTFGVVFIRALIGLGR